MERMRELAFGNLEVDFKSKAGNKRIRRMPEIGSGQEDAWQWHARCALRPSEEERRCNTMLICLRK